MFGLGWPELLTLTINVILIIILLLIAYIILKRIVRQEVRKSLEENDRSRSLVGDASHD